MIDFDKMIINYLERRSYPKKVGRYYPSSIGQCMRKYWYSYKHPMETEPRLHKIFHLGNVIHDFVVDVLRSEKNPNVELLKAEMPVRLDLKDFLISGRIDDLVLLRANGRKLLVEVKSVKDIQYQDKPGNAHKMQLQFYMYATGIHDGVLLYIDKIALDSKIFEIPYSKAEAMKIIKRFALFHRLLINNELPEPEAKKDSESKWMCNFCEYRNRCERNEK